MGYCLRPTFQRRAGHTGGGGGALGYVNPEPAFGVGPRPLDGAVGCVVHDNDLGAPVHLREPVNEQLCQASDAGERGHRSVSRPLRGGAPGDFFPLESRSDSRKSRRGQWGSLLTLDCVASPTKGFREGRVMAVRWPSTKGSHVSWHRGLQAGSDIELLLTKFKVWPGRVVNFQKNTRVLLT